MLALLLVGCVAQPGLFAPVPLDDPEAIEQIPERAFIDAMGMGSFGHEGAAFAPLEEESWWGRQMVSSGRQVTVVDPGERLGVVVEWGRGIRLLVHLDRGDMRDLIVEPVWAGAAGSWSEHGEVGVRFPYGHDARAMVDERGGRTLEHNGAIFGAVAWVPPHAVDQVFRPGDSFDKPGTTDEYAWVPTGTDVLDAPDGEWLGRIGGLDVDASEFPHALDRLEVAGDWQRVQVEERGVVLRGWVPWFDEPDRYGGTGGCGCGGLGTWGVGSGWTSHPNVFEGDVLYDDVAGAEVGLVLRDQRLELVDETGDGWGGYELSTPWGLTTVWIDTGER